MRGRSPRVRTHPRVLIRSITRAVQTCPIAVRLTGLVALWLAVTVGSYLGLIYLDDGTSAHPDANIHPSSPPSVSEPAEWVTGVSKPRPIEVDVAILPDGSVKYRYTIKTVKTDPLVRRIEADELGMREALRELAGFEVRRAPGTLKLTPSSAIVEYSATETVPWEDNDLPYFDSDGYSWLDLASTGLHRHALIDTAPLTYSISIEGGKLISTGSSLLPYSQDANRIVFRTTIGDFSRAQPNVRLHLDVARQFQEPGAPSDYTFVYWPASILFPFILIILAMRGSQAAPERTLRNGSSAVVATFLLVGLGYVLRQEFAVGEYPDLLSLQSQLIVAVPLLCVLLLTVAMSRFGGLDRNTAAAPLALLVTTAVGAMDTGWYFISHGETTPELLASISMSIGATLVAPVAWKQLGRRAGLTWVLAATVILGGTMAVSDLGYYNAVLIYDLALASCTIYILRYWGHVNPSHYVIAFLVSMLGFGVLAFSRDGGSSLLTGTSANKGFAMLVAQAASLLSLLCMILYLHEQGKVRGRPTDGRVVAAGVVAITIVCRPPYASLMTDFLPIALTAVFANAIIVDSRRRRQLAVLARIDHQELRSLVEEHAESNSARDALHGYLRSNPGTLTRDADWHEWTVARSRLREVLESHRRPYANGLSRTHAALGAPLARSNWQNALATASIGFVVTLATFLLDYWLMPSLVVSRDAGIARAVEILFLARWVFYSGFLGYFYTVIRGYSPLTKTASLFVAAAVPEALRVLLVSSSGSPWALALTIRLGQLLVLCLSLGLFWEWRLARAVDLPFSTIRDYRKLRSMAVPVSAVLVAVATAAGTAIASATVSTILTPMVPPLSKTATPPSPSPSPDVPP